MVKYETISKIHKITGRTAVIFSIMILYIGAAGAIVGGLYWLVVHINKLLNWGEWGIAFWTIVLFLFFCSLGMAIVEDYPDASQEG